MVNTYYLLHVAGGFLLTAFTILATATAVSGKNKRLLMITGVLSLVVLVGGFGLIARVYDNTWPTWVFLKIGAWLVLSMAAGMAMKRPSKAPMWTGLSVLAVLTAIFADQLIHYRPLE
ncbi:MAG: hypothetical protein P1V81_18390, partial [Planctomycetota bacterium]|nr:hypothetical protein [Planctomycetota bacterium]